MHVCVVLKNDYPASHIKQGRITHHQLTDSFFLKTTTEVASLVCVCVCVGTGKLCLIACLRCCFGSSWRSKNVALRDALIVITFSFCWTLRPVPGCICWKLQYFVRWGCCPLSCVRRYGISSLCAMGCGYNRWMVTTPYCPTPVRALTDVGLGTAYTSINRLFSHVVISGYLRVLSSTTVISYIIGWNSLCIISLIY